ncbi:hypothetical protein LTS10_007847 [Elasticomyces elasticus]|nr:hypothetical protein LTS10_007847 [Elasticomyces elasticus]
MTTRPGYDLEISSRELPPEEGGGHDRGRPLTRAAEVDENGREATREEKQHIIAELLRQVKVLSAPQQADNERNQNHLRSLGYSDDRKKNYISMAEGNAFVANIYEVKQDANIDRSSALFLDTDTDSLIKKGYIFDSVSRLPDGCWAIKIGTRHSRGCDGLDKRTSFRVVSRDEQSPPTVWNKDDKLGIGPIEMVGKLKMDEYAYG